MARIRTIKPQFFLHEGLFDLERETKLPIRLSFVGLWCQADREGRFAWRPRALGAQILPYDKLDFSRVLHALTTRGFLVRYASNGSEFGWIPTFKKHQIVNNRESDSDLPDPNSSACQIITSTRDARVPDASQSYLSGREQEGKGTGREQEQEGEGASPLKPQLDISTSKVGVRGCKGEGDSFEEFWQAYPEGRKEKKAKAHEAWVKAIRKASPETIIAAAVEYADSYQAKSQFVKGPVPWLNGGCWDDDRAAWNRTPDPRGSRALMEAFYTEGESYVEEG